MRLMLVCASAVTLPTIIEITAITKATAKAPAGKLIDLRGSKTLMPGLIDAHSHLTWYFNAQGRYHTNADGETAEQGLAAAVANAHATLMAGFTTARDLGTEGAGYADVALKRAIDDYGDQGRGDLADLLAWIRGE